MIFSESNIYIVLVLYNKLDIYKSYFPMCYVVFNKTNVILRHLLASLILQFEKFYVKSSVCFCLISVKVSEFIYLEIHLRKQLRRTQKWCTV